MALNPPISSIPVQENGQQGHIFRFLESIAPYQDRFATAFVDQPEPTERTRPGQSRSEEGHTLTRGSLIPQANEKERFETESAKRRIDRKMRRRANAAIVKPKIDSISLGEALRETIRYSQERRKEAERQEQVERERDRKRKASEEVDAGRRGRQKRQGDDSRTTHPDLFLSPNRRVTIPLDKALGRRLGIKESKVMRPPDLRASPGASQEGSTVSDTRPNIQSHYFSLPPVSIDLKPNLPKRPTTREDKMSSDIRGFARRDRLPSVGIAGSASWPSASSVQRGSRGSNQPPPHDDQTHPTPIPHQPADLSQRHSTGPPHTTSPCSSFQFVPAPIPTRGRAASHRPPALASSSSRRSSLLNQMPTTHDRLTAPHMSYDALDDRRWIHGPSNRATPGALCLQIDRQDPQQIETSRVGLGRALRRAGPNERYVREGRLIAQYEQDDGPYSQSFDWSPALDRRFDGRAYGESQSVQVGTGRPYGADYHQDVDPDQNYQDARQEDYDPYEPQLATPRLPAPDDTTQDIQYQLAEIQYQDHQAVIQPYETDVHQHARSDLGHDTNQYPWGPRVHPYSRKSETSRIVKEEMENPFVAPNEQGYYGYNGAHSERAPFGDYWQERAGDGTVWQGIGGPGNEYYAPEMRDYAQYEEYR